MPGVTKDGKSTGDYGYDVGGKTTPINRHVDRGDKMPPHGQLGRLDEDNTDRFIERKNSSNDPPSQMAKTGYESTAFDKYGCVKANKPSNVDFLEKDGSWAPAEGRGKSTSGNVMRRGEQSGSITK